MSENGQEEKKPGALGFVTTLSERILESQTSSNLLIIALIILVAIPFLGIGIMATRALAPVDRIEMSN
ncbi:MAG: hypothetical protein AAB804_01265 [Patescibacteria group bacterium]|mgnify:CR=1 FL=1